MDSKIFKHRLVIQSD